MNQGGQQELDVQAVVQVWEIDFQKKKVEPNLAKEKVTPGIRGNVPAKWLEVTKTGHRYGGICVDEGGKSMVEDTTPDWGEEKSVRGRSVGSWAVDSGFPAKRILSYCS